MGDHNGKCDDCGRFMKYEGGASSADIFDFIAMECIETRTRCASCTSQLGPLPSNARPANGDMRPYETIYP